MMYSIFVKTKTGEVFNSIWTGDKDLGKSRARYEAYLGGYSVQKVWSTPEYSRNYIPRTETMKKFMNYVRTKGVKYVTYTGPWQGKDRCPSNCYWIVPGTLDLS